MISICNELSKNMYAVFLSGYLGMHKVVKLVLSGCWILMF